MDDKQKETENPKLTVNKKNSGPMTPNNGSKAVSVQPQIRQIRSAVPERASKKKLDSDNSIISTFVSKQEPQTTPIVPTPTATAGAPHTLPTPQQLQEQATPKVSTPQQLLRTSKQVSPKSDNYYDAMPAKTSHNIPPDINMLTEEQLKAHLENIEMSEKKAVGKKPQAVQPSKPSPSPSPPAYPPQPLQASAKSPVNSLSQITYPKSVPKVYPKLSVASSTSNSSMSSKSSTSPGDKSIRCNECNCKCIIPIVAASCKKCGCVCSSIRNLDTCSHKFSVYIKHAQTFTKFEESKTENKKQTAIEEPKSTAKKKNSDDSNKRSKSK